MTPSQLPLPTRGQIKSLINLNMWFVLGRLFNFTPIFLTDKNPKKPHRRTNTIDWRCVPPAMYEILQCRDEAEVKAQDAKENKPSKESKRRKVLYENQGSICHYCLYQTPYNKWSIDHILPRSKGGTDRIQNLVGACKTCNGQKGSQSIEDFMKSDYIQKVRQRKVIDAAP